MESGKNSFFTRETLLDRIKDQSDEEAWQEFSEIYRPYIYRIIQNLKVPASEIEDILQNILIISWRKLPEFQYDKNKGRFRGWLATVTKRDVLQYYKKNQTPKAISIESIEQHCSTESQLEKMIEEEWVSYVSEMAWKKVKPLFSSKVLDCFQALAEGKSGEEVSKETGLSKSSVYVYKKRVLAALQKEMAALSQL